MALVTKLSTEPVEYTKEQLEERRLKRVPVAASLLDLWLRGKNEHQVVLRYESDLPEDCRLRHMSYDPAYDCMMLFYWHPSWDIVPPECEVPSLVVTMTSHVYQVVDAECVTAEPSPPLLRANA